MPSFTTIILALKLSTFKLSLSFPNERNRYESLVNNFEYNENLDIPEDLTSLISQATDEDNLLQCITAMNNTDLSDVSAANDTVIDNHDYVLDDESHIAYLARCAHIKNVTFLRNGTFSTVYSAVHISSGSAVALKVTPLEKSLQCVSKFQMTLRSKPRGINIIHKWGCATKNIPIEAFVLRYLKGFKGRTPRLVKHLNWLGHFNIIFMQYFNNRYLLSNIIANRNAYCLRESETKLFILNLLYFQRELLGKRIIHLDMQVNNVFMYPGQRVKVIDFNLVDLDFDSNALRTTRSFVFSFNYDRSKLLYPPEATHLHKIEKYPKGIFKYVPAKYAIYQVGAIWHYISYNPLGFVPDLLKDHYTSFINIQFNPICHTLSDEGVSIMASFLKANASKRPTFQYTMRLIYFRIFQVGNITHYLTRPVD
ncbi:hypothetical protein GJ496_004068 [Pomphorhynchus laevis]|nr:hypothetical protein GJ496_004068 [Pomphorhynchus laevis]